MMLNVNEYINTVRQLERQIEEYNLRLDYRKLELNPGGDATTTDTISLNMGSYTVSGCSVSAGYTSPKPEINYEADMEYANLKYKRDIFKKKLDFVKKHRCLPDEI